MLKEMRIFSQLDYEPELPKALPDDDIVDRDGYRDTQTMVEEMQSAGVLLNAIRRGVEEDYEYGPEDPVGTEELDPTRAQGFDVIDAQRISEKTTENINAALEADKKAAVEKAEAEKPKVADERAT